MGSIIELPDALLLKILSSLPSAKDVVATMVLSKRWQFLWMFVPKLVFDDSYQNIDYAKFSRFVDRSLLLHEAPVLETLHFKVGHKSKDVDIGVWTRTAVKRSVRELIIEFDTSYSTTLPLLPRSLCTDCRMVETLELHNLSFVDVSSSVSFPSLKKLRLVWVVFPNDQFVERLLSGCPLLEDLYVEQCPYDKVTVFTVRVPSLKRLLFHVFPLKFEDCSIQGLVVDAPSLEFLNVVDVKGEYCVIENIMPKIVTAHVEVSHSHPESILRSISSVKRLYLCLTTSKDAYPFGCIFHRLVHLDICTCVTGWLNLLMCVLRCSPNLLALKLKKCHTLQDNLQRPCWIEPSSVPECVLSSLETLEWMKYEGSEEEKEMVAFILRSGSCLKKVTVSSKSTDLNQKFEMIKELSLLPRGSLTCQLAFD